MCVCVTGLLHSLWVQRAVKGPVPCLSPFVKKEDTLLTIKDGNCSKNAANMSEISFVFEGSRTASSQLFQVSAQVFCC